MKSTSGEHYVAFDHIRAIALFLVFEWHFMHGNGHPVPLQGSPFWGPLVLIDEGHVGVALFMTLSGYLFAKLLHNKESINYRLFLRNRVLRLFPLLILVMVLSAVLKAFQGEEYVVVLTLLTFIEGFILPTWPNGGWSITTELHFYILLPILRALKERSSLFLLLLIALAFGIRTLFFSIQGEVQSIAYWTILGRIDQFVLGILGFYWSGFFKKNHVLIAFISAFFLSIYYWFNVNGGFSMLEGYPSHSSIWIWLPTAEGITFAALIAWYETSFTHQQGILSNTLSTIGEYSYSLYLLHYFFVFDVAKYIDKHLLDISDFYVALPISIIVFLAMVPIGMLSMKFIEAPFLRYRKPYYKTPKSFQR
ncbi:acyltransferase [Leptolyngbya sp. PL-A3]|uniref:acyltransferase family protein n=1 Tax=Leptolyngbya sp. PL-A3 TaxID=2933911 RepID=UPI0032979188